VRKTGFLVHGFGDGDVDFFSIVKVCADFIADFSLGEFDVVFGGTFAGHQTEKSLVNVNQLVFSASNVGDIHVVSGGTEIFVFPLSKDINSNQMDFSVTVFAGFGGTHVDNLARTTFNKNIPVLTKRRTLLRKTQGRTRRGGGEIVFMICVVCHGDG